MHIHLNSGNDIKTPAQIVKTSFFGGGVSLSVTLCEFITSPPVVICKIDGVSKLSNIEFTTEGIHVLRAYGVGYSAVNGSTPGAPKLFLFRRKKADYHNTSRWNPWCWRLDETRRRACNSKRGTVYTPRRRMYQDVPEVLLHDATLRLWQTPTCSKAWDPFWQSFIRVCRAPGGTANAGTSCRNNQFAHKWHKQTSNVLGT